MDTSPVLIGTSQAVREVEDEANDAARFEATVLITGERGVGRETVARLIHERSPRARRPLVKVHGASFTRASRDNHELLADAYGGTIVIGEVGEMSLRTQAALLRFLETGEISQSANGGGLQSINAHVIATTRGSLFDGLSSNAFRDDLYYRLNAVHIEIPPLRDRCEDVPVLLDHFLRLFSETHRRPMPEVTAGAMDRLMAYRWPGNVRELKRVAERLVLACRDGRIDVNEVASDLPFDVPGDSPSFGGRYAPALHATRH